jgi:osmotically-inducible protein OsmY
MRRIWLALPVAAGALIVGAMSPRAAADESSTGADRDKQQEQQIQAQFQTTRDLENNRIDVSVDDGIAVLEGTVDSQREKKEAQQLAHVDGILGVNNRLKVRGAGK